MPVPIGPPRPARLILSAHGFAVVGEILNGTRSHKDLKHAFDWENTPDGHRYWSLVRNKLKGLSPEARIKLEIAWRNAAINYEPNNT